MKTYSRLKLFCVALMTGFALSSCLDSEDPEFGITGISAYVNQKTTQVVGGDSTTNRYEYLPVIQVMANDVISQSVCQGPNGVIPLEFAPGYYNTLVRTEYSFMSVSSSFPAGSYTVQLTNADSETCSYTFSISAMEPLGYIKITEAPTSANGRISVKWADVENADSYQICIFEKGEELYARYSTNSISAESYKEEDGITFTLDSDDMTLYGLTAGTQYDVCVAAISQSTSGTIISYSDKTTITL